MKTEEILRNIRVDLRTSMDGIVSQSMREKGLGYKLNFGVRTVRLQEMAKNYNKNVELAETLWEQETRELKILATLLFPIESFTEEMADEWVKSIPNQEIREQVCKNLFQELSFADKLAGRWILSEDEDIRATGYWLLARLIIVRSPLTDSCNLAQVINSAIRDAADESYFLRNSALSALKYLGRLSKEVARQILDNVSDYKDSDDKHKNEIYEGLNFEFSLLYS